MLPGLFFTFWRVCQIITLIPVVGMLSWFVNGYTNNNTLTPISVLVLFIISVLALVWAVGTLVGYGYTKHNGYFVALIDMLFFGALIAAVYELRGIGGANCSNFSTSGIYTTLGPFGAQGVATGNTYADNLSKNCSMLKASFAFGIMNIVFFFFTSFIALWIQHKHRHDDTYVRSNRTRSGSGPRVIEERYTRRSNSRSRHGPGSTYTRDTYSQRPHSHHHHGSRRSSRSRAVI